MRSADSPGGFPLQGYSAPPRRRNPSRKSAAVSGSKQGRARNRGCGPFPWDSRAASRAGLSALAPPTFEPPPQNFQKDHPAPDCEGISAMGMRRNYAFRLGSTHDCVTGGPRQTLSNGHCGISGRIPRGPKMHHKKWTLDTRNNSGFGQLRRSNTEHICLIANIKIRHPFI